MALESCDTCEIQVKIHRHSLRKIAHLLTYLQVINHIDLVVKFSLKVPYSSISGSLFMVRHTWWMKHIHGLLRC